MEKTLILTGWGWTEYAVAAAALLKALNGRADVLGMSKRRLPEFLEAEGAKWRSIYLVGLSLGGDEARLQAALKALGGAKRVTWVSGLAMSEPQRRNLAPLLKVCEYGGGPFGGSLVKAVGRALDVDVSAFLPFADEKAKLPKSVPSYRELVAAAMYAYRNYQDESSYAQTIRSLADGMPPEAWDAEAKRLVEHYRRYGSRELVGKSEKMRELRDYIGRIAAHPEARVLILGESGTGKETVALQIHTKSPRRNEPFYAFNCASINKELLESRFFGHEKGAFTGADRQEPGLFELADGGTLFLDEIGELPLEAQGVLLRVLEGGRFMRLGGRTEIKTDVRLITATNRDLPAMVRDGKFREDLFMRLNVVQIRVPSLRERKEDIRDIADIWWFTRFRKHLPDAQVAALQTYDYPGNVRELLNLLERAAVLDETDFARLVARHREMNVGLLRTTGMAQRHDCGGLGETALPGCGETVRQGGGVADQLGGGATSDDLEAVIRGHVRSVFAKYAQNLSQTAAALRISRNRLRRYIESDGLDDSGGPNRTA